MTQQGPDTKDPKEIQDALNEDEAFRYIQNQSILDNTGTSKDEFYDVLTTEDALMAIYKN